MQLAQAAEHPDLTDKAAEKGHEVTGAVSGAAHAVRKAHRHHEATEGTHHTVSSKVGAKIDEAHQEVEGAKNAVKAEHEQHEATERTEGRD
jgi:hypothetical protein